MAVFNHHPTKRRNAGFLMPLIRRIASIATDTFVHRELWTTLAHVDLRNRYRGSFLGPLWLTIATGVLVGGIGLLYGGLFGQPLHSYLPYIAISIVTWTLISTTLSEAATLFPGEGIILKQLPVPPSLFITRLVYRNVLVAGHNSIIVLIVLVIFPPSIGWGVMTVLLGLLVLLLNIWWISVILSIIGARFRDVPPIIASALQILFFLTPIIWRAEDIPKREALINLNPLYHLIEIVRDPFINGSMPWLSLILCTAMAAIGTAMAVYILEWSRIRLIYWL